MISNGLKCILKIALISEELLTRVRAKIKMPRSGEGIRKEHWPPKAARYPGLKNKDNVKGLDVTKEKYIENVIESWVQHFSDNHKELYDKTFTADKFKALTSHLSQINMRGINKDDLKTMLLKIERTKNDETEEENIQRQSQEIFMDQDLVMFYFDLLQLSNYLPINLSIYLSIHLSI